ncbi:MAG TPA: S8 family serine peptidase, partial [Coleofasciculaceae cyanobacterium]
LEKSLDAPLYLTDQITVQFTTHIHAEQMRSLAASSGLQIMKLVPGIAKCFVFRVMPQAAANPLKIAQRLLADPNVLLAEPNIAVLLQQVDWSEKASCHLPPPDPAFNPALNPAPNPAPNPEAQMDLKAAWEVTRGDRTVIIAIMAASIDCNHPDLTGIGKIVSPWSSQQPLPALTQGTRCARIALAEKNGIAPGCSFMPIETGDCLDDQSVETWFEWAGQQGAAVIFCSWGAPPAYFPLSLRQRLAIARSATQGRGGKGCVIIFAAGNESSAGADPLAHSPVLNGFAWHPDVITVAASDRLNQSAFHLCGNVAVVAPSDTAEEIAQDMAAGARVAGVAALVLSVNPNLTAAAVREILQTTADKIVRTSSPSSLDAPSPDMIYDAAGYSQQFGYGKVNALQAVQAAQQTASCPLVAEWLQFQNLEAIAIPDGDLQGVTSTIQVKDDRQLLDIEISISLEHQFASDLELYLLAPNGETILLQSRSLGRLTKISKSYSQATTPLLKRLINQSVQGQWQLKLIDCVPLDLGYLQSWTLNLGV